MACLEVADRPLHLTASSLLAKQLQRSECERAALVARLGFWRSCLLRPSLEQALGNMDVHAAIRQAEAELERLDPVDRKDITSAVLGSGVDLKLHPPPKSHFQPAEPQMDSWLRLHVPSSLSLSSFSNAAGEVMTKSIPSEEGPRRRLEEQVRPPVKRVRTSEPPPLWEPVHAAYQAERPLQEPFQTERPPQDPAKSAWPVSAGSGLSNASIRSKPAGFITGARKMQLDDLHQRGHGSGHRDRSNAASSLGIQRETGLGAGARATGLRRQRGFVPPYKTKQDNTPAFVKTALEEPQVSKDVPARYKGLDPKLIELITCDMMERSPGVSWNDIAGLDFQKQSVKEIVVWPMKRPDLFQGLRGPPKGMLLFGPPGTGKTLIGKAIASEAGATFFSISASSLTSKWHGQGEKLVRCLFAVAAEHQPAIIFIDEIDSLLSQRSDSEFEGSRRLKTEFLVQLDGAATSENDRILVVGATNRPQELDEAARRRLVKRLYVPLPESQARRDLILNLLRKERHDMSEEHIADVVAKTDGYSGADLRALCTEAAYGPIRSVNDISSLDTNNVRPIGHQDFLQGLSMVRASVSSSDLKQYLVWNNQFGSFPAERSHAA
eukprot:g39982.t1